MNYTAVHSVFKEASLRAFGGVDVFGTVGIILLSFRLYVSQQWPKFLIFNKVFGGSFSPNAKDVNTVVSGKGKMEKTNKFRKLYIIQITSRILTQKQKTAAEIRFGGLAW